MFINTLPLRLTQSDASVVATLADSQRVLVQALQHAHVPFYQIVAARGVRRAASHSPLFQAMFQVNSITSHILEENRNAVSEPTVKVDLEMHLFHCDGELDGGRKARD